MTRFILDGTRVSTEAAFWKEYLAVVRPEGAEHFGRNLDAFHDAVAGGPGWPGSNACLRIVNHAAAGVSQNFWADLVEIANGVEGFEIDLA